MQHTQCIADRMCAVQSGQSDALARLDATLGALDLTTEEVDFDEIGGRQQHQQQQGGREREREIIVCVCCVYMGMSLPLPSFTCCLVSAARIEMSLSDEYVKRAVREGKDLRTFTNSLETDLVKVRSRLECRVACRCVYGPSYQFDSICDVS